MKNYFSHDSDARNDEKVIRLRMKHKAAGYGVYFMILERMRESTNYMCAKDYNMIAFDLREDAALVKSVVEDFGLFVFTDDREYFYSESFRKRMNESDIRKRKLSDAGRAGMTRRWTKTSDEAPERPTETTDSPSQPTAKQWTDEDYARQFVEVFKKAIDTYQSRICIKTLSKERIEAIMTLYRRFPDAKLIKEGIINAARSEYLNGKTPRRKTPASFDWIIQPDNFLKILEGSI
ncbi:MAG: DUF4373 domain-containing protein [Bacteroidaceae bacterium]|nr:DUF4373 domain-containing protein [Bacteroidaceae bacterium]